MNSCSDENVQYKLLYMVRRPAAQEEALITHFRRGGMGKVHIMWQKIIMGL